MRGLQKTKNKKQAKPQQTCNTNKCATRCLRLILHVSGRDDIDMSAHIDALVEEKFLDFVTIRLIRNPVALQELEQSTADRVRALTPTGHDCDFLHVAHGSLQKSRAACFQKV